MHRCAFWRAHGDTVRDRSSGAALLGNPMVSKGTDGMNCIFCKGDSSASRSVEHVIPESLGNTDHVLPVGVVCDKCNAYFARKVEQPLLELPYFRHMCHRARIRSKKGNPPRIQGMHLESAAEIWLSPDMIGAADPKDERRFVECISRRARGTLIVPIPAEPGEQVVSRFLAKVAIEVLALRFVDVPGGIRSIVEKAELDPLREYARRGTRNQLWPFHKRTIYPPDFLFRESSSEWYEVTHEWTLLYTEEQELYLVVALFGVEYAMNMGGPETDGFRDWLSDHSGRSPLYPTGMKGGQWPGRSPLR